MKAIPLLAVLALGGCYNPGLDALRQSERDCQQGNYPQACAVMPTYTAFVASQGRPDELPPDLGLLGTLAIIVSGFVTPTSVPHHHRRHHHAP